MTQPMANAWSEHMRSLLGKRVEVILQREPNRVAITGQLLSFTEDGEVCVRDELFVAHWGWPNLDTQPLDTPPACCDGTGLADYAAVPCPNPDCPVPVPTEPAPDLPALTAKWVADAERMEHDMRERAELTDAGRAALLHQAVAMRGCAEELRAAMGER